MAFHILGLWTEKAAKCGGAAANILNNQLQPHKRESPPFWKLDMELSLLYHKKIHITNLKIGLLLSANKSSQNHEPHNMLQLQYKGMIITHLTEIYKTITTENVILYLNTSLYPETLIIKVKCLCV